MTTETSTPTTDTAPAAPPATPEAPPTPPAPTVFDRLRSPDPIDKVKAEIAATKVRPSNVVDVDEIEAPPAEELEAGDDGPADETPSAPAAAPPEGEEPAEPIVEPAEPTDPVERPSLRLLARRRGEPDVELPIDWGALEAAGIDATAALERVQQAQNTVGRYDDYVQARAVVEADRRELEEIGQRLRRPESAAEFVLEKLSPQIRNQVVERLLVGLDDATYDQLMTKASEWDRDPAQRKERALQEREKRLQEREQREAPGGVTRADQERAAQVVAKIVSLAPDDWPTPRLERYRAMATSALIDHMERAGLDDLDPGEVPQVLARLGILEDYGLQSNGASSASETPPSKGSVTEAQRAAAEAAGKKIRGRTERRENAATAPAGAGPVLPGGLMPPKGQTPKERFDWIRATARRK